MDKTPGQVAREVFFGEYGWSDTTTPEAKEEWERCAQAVIDHVRPQIEREAYENVINAVEEYLPRLKSEFTEGK